MTEMAIFFLMVVAYAMAVCFVATMASHFFGKPIGLLLGIAAPLGIAFVLTQIACSLGDHFGEWLEGKVYE